MPALSFYLKVIHVDSVQLEIYDTNVLKLYERVLGAVKDCKNTWWSFLKLAS